MIDLMFVDFSFVLRRAILRVLYIVLLGFYPKTVGEVKVRNTYTEGNQVVIKAKEDQKKLGVFR